METNGWQGDAEVVGEYPEVMALQMTLQVAGCYSCELWAYVGLELIGALFCESCNVVTRCVGVAALRFEMACL